MPKLWTMRLDPRPSPPQVTAYLAGDVTDDALHGCLLTLHADPNWCVVATPGPSSWDLALTYSPAGTHQHIRLDRLERSGTILWRRRPQPWA